MYVCVDFCEDTHTYKGIYVQEDLPTEVKRIGHCFLNTEK